MIEELKRMRRQWSQMDDIDRALYSVVIGVLTAWVKTESSSFAKVALWLMVTVALDARLHQPLLSHLDGEDNRAPPWTALLAADRPYRGVGAVFFFNKRARVALPNHSHAKAAHTAEDLPRDGFKG